MLAQSSTSVIPFLGAEVAADYNAARVVILPIPYEATTTYRRGCENGPDAILEASRYLELYDEELDREICPSVRIYTHPAIADTRNGPIAVDEMLHITSEKVCNLVRDGKFVISLGGEHSISIGIVEAYRQAYPNEAFTVIQIDAGGDLRSEYQGSFFDRACVMRRILDLGLPTVQVGVRSLCQEEADLIKEKNLIVFRGREIAYQPDWMERAIRSIPTQKVFITIDLNGIDPAVIPGVGNPEPGGLNWYALTSFLRGVIETYQVIGCDVMELSPVVDAVVSEFTTAKLVYKLIGYQALAEGWIE